MEICVHALELVTLSALPVPMLIQVYAKAQKCCKIQWFLNMFLKKGIQLNVFFSIFTSFLQDAISSRLGTILGDLRTHLGSPWGHLGRTWGHLGAILGPSWPTWGHLGRSWGSLGQS